MGVWRHGCINVCPDPPHPFLADLSPHLPHPASREFLQTREWKELRYRAFLKYGNRCVVCGRSAKQGAILNMDHIKPRAKYPHLALDINNLQPACSDCNTGKGNWDSTDWR
jgi:5-methylcytosine-specific restriction endonuclease McrA